MLSSNTTDRTIPTEIIQDILGWLDNKDLLQLQLTCKKWSSSAKSLIYTNVVFKSFSQEAFQSYIATLRADSLGELGKLAMSFSLSESYCLKWNWLGLADTAATLLFNEILSELCRNVTSLFAGAPVPFTLFRSGLCDAIQNNKLLILTALPDLYQVSPDHTFVTDFYRNQLTYVSFAEDDPRLYDDEHGSTWPRLETLKVIMTYSHAISKFDSILQRSPLLKSLEFFAEGDIDYDNNEEELYYIDCGIFEDEYNTSGWYVETKTDLTLVQPHLSLRTLKGYIVIITGESLNYSMHKFPRLDHLHLYIGTDFATSGYEEEGDFTYEMAESFHFTQDIMTRFLDYVLGMSSFCVRNIRLSNSEDVVVNYMLQRDFSGVLELAYIVKGGGSGGTDGVKLWTLSNLRLRLDNQYKTYASVPSLDKERIAIEF